MGKSWNPSTLAQWKVALQQWGQVHLQRVGLFSEPEPCSFNWAITRTDLWEILTQKELSWKLRTNWKGAFILALLPYQYPIIYTF